jgi:hypothetical protein
LPFAGFLPGNDDSGTAADIIEQAFGIGAQRAGLWMDSVAAD